MDDPTDDLAAARAAYARRDWHAASDAFSTASATRELTADDLAAYSNATWWLGRMDETLRLTESSYRQFLAESRPNDAAKAALDLAVVHYLRGDEPQGSGWAGRAGHLARELPECPLHGYLLYLTGVEANFGRADPVAAVEAARRVQELGRRFGDSNLVAAGLNGEGRALLKTGNVVDGMALLDEAMLIVLDGDLTPDIAGNLYCNTIAACHEVVDLRRMKRWTELAERWVLSLPAAALFDGICRVHRAQLLVLHGDWDRAERNARQVAADLDEISVANAAEAWYVVAEVRRLRGDRTGAEAAYDRAHARGRDPQPGLALLRLQAGDTDGAVRSIRSALSAVGPDPLERAPICAAAVEIALAAGRIEDARKAASELSGTAERYATSGLEVMAVAARGAILLAEGESEQALAVLRDACRRWHDLGAKYEAASTSVKLAAAYRALDDLASADLELGRAGEVFGLLGATPAPAGGEDDRGIGGGLTRREHEVLALVAEGRSNRQIAEKLFISDRTVARHLTNIFHKLGVESRTAAAHYALVHRLVRTLPDP